MYGFSKIESGQEGLWSYFHPDFERDDQVKALSIQRQSAARKNHNYYHHHQVSSAVSSSKPSIVARSHKKGKEEAGIGADKNDQTNEYDSTAVKNQTPKCVSVVMPNLSHDFNWPCNIDVCRPLSGSPQGTLADCLAILDRNLGTTLSNQGPLSLSSSERNSCCQQEEEQEADDDQQCFEGLEPRPIELMLKEEHGSSSCTYYYPWMTKNDIL